jgi:staphylococcal nuclease domain-containing protein 1
VEPKYDVYFLDFGNKEKLSSERVRTIDAALSAVPPQARPACLAYLKVCTAGTARHGMACSCWVSSILSLLVA